MNDFLLIRLVTHVWTVDKLMGVGIAEEAIYTKTTIGFLEVQFIFHHRVSLFVVFEVL